MSEPSDPSAVASASPTRERAIVYLMAAVQFVNVLDFMMVNPLGPQLSEALDVPTPQLPVVAGSYTAAASISGLVGALHLERFDRKKALVVCLAGLAIGTMLGGFATGLPTLVLSRIVAGLFGGPATSLTSAIVADTIPPERRGWAFGIVMGGFAVASVLGVPAGLALAQLGGWRAPFFGVAGVIVLAIVAAMRLLPSLGAHLAAAKDASRDGLSASLFELLGKPVVRSSLVLTAVTMMSSFVVIPTIPAYVQYNLELPPERLGLLYLFGGIASFLSTRLAGPLVDRLGAFRVSLAAAVGVSLVLWALFVRLAPVPVLVLTTAFFVVMGARGVAYNALTSMVPDAHERARFQSVQSAVQHGASSAAAFVAAQLLVELPGHKLGHVDRVGICAIALSLAVPISVAFVERALARRREATV